MYNLKCTSSDWQGITKLGLFEEKKLFFKTNSQRFISFEWNKGLTKESNTFSSKATLFNKQNMMVGGFYLNMHPSFVPTLFPCLSDILNHLFRFSCLVVIPFHVQVCKTMSIICFSPSLTYKTCCILFKLNQIVKKLTIIYNFKLLVRKTIWTLSTIINLLHFWLDWFERMSKPKMKIYQLQNNNNNNSLSKISSFIWKTVCLLGSCKGVEKAIIFSMTVKREHFSSNQHHQSERKKVIWYFWKITKIDIHPRIGM